MSDTLGRKEDCMLMTTDQLSSPKSRAALRQGDAYADALEIMQDEVDIFASREVDDYIVTLALEDAEGMYWPDSDSTLTWLKPRAAMNKHLEIAVQDARDGRFVPGLRLRASVMSKGGDIMYEDDLPFLWHPFLWHYGSNIHLDGAGKYNFEITIMQPQFGRHDEAKGELYVRDVIVNFHDVYLEPGRKPRGPE